MGNQSILLVFYLSSVEALTSFKRNVYDKRRKNKKQRQSQANINSVVHCSVVINQNCKHSGSEVDLCGNNQQHCSAV